MARFTEYDAPPPIDVWYYKKDEEAIDWLFRRGILNPKQHLKLHNKILRRWKKLRDGADD